MTRVKGGTVSKNRRRKVLKQAKGYFGSKHRLYKTAQEQLFHSGEYAYRDRKQNKRNFRKLWITRINAAARVEGISYSKLIAGLDKAGVEVNRKMLAELAVNDTAAFKNLVEIAKNGKVKETTKKDEVKAEAKEDKKTPAKKTTTKKVAEKTTTTKKKTTTTTKKSTKATK